jgi:hypothetical protein
MRHAGSVKPAPVVFARSFSIPTKFFRAKRHQRFLLTGAFLNRFQKNLESLAFDDRIVSHFNTFLSSEIALGLLLLTHSHTKARFIFQVEFFTLLRKNLKTPDSPASPASTPVKRVS